MMRGKNKFLFISFLLGFAYSLYLLLYFTGAIGSSEGANQAGAALATAIVMPHMVLTVLATIFNGLGCFLVLMPIYFMFVVLQMILSFIGFAKLKKGNE